MKRFSIAALIAMTFIAFSGYFAISVDSNGWEFPICTAPETQGSPQVIEDGTGGAIFTWYDDRGPDTDIYAQKIDGAGNIQWAYNGIAVCGYADSQTDPLLVTDGAGGAVIVWRDYRVPTYQIFAQRVDLDGVLQWNADGVLITTVEELFSEFEVVPDGDGGVITTWGDDWGDEVGANGKLFIQRTDQNGLLSWGANGVAVCTTLTYMSSPKMVSDGTGGAVVSWGDGRAGAGGIYAQRYDSSGEAKWAEDGVPICTPTGGILAMTTDGSGGAVISWAGIDGVIYAQRVNSNGSVQWTVNGVAVGNWVGSSANLCMAPDGAGGAVLAWEDASRGWGQEDIYAQRVLGNGSIGWEVGGVPACTLMTSQVDPNICTDGSGGAIVTWRDYRSYQEIYSQRIDSDGVTQCEPDGYVVTPGPWTHAWHQSASDGAGGAFVTWRDKRGGEKDIYATRISNACGFVPTLLENSSAFYDENEIVIQWSLSDVGDGDRFSVTRANGTGSQFTELALLEVRTDKLTYIYRDADCMPGSTYRYRVELLDDIETRILFETGPIVTPYSSTTLHQNHPNPFNPTTTISFTLPESMPANLSIYNIEGKLIKTITDQFLDAGSHVSVWDGTDTRGNAVSSGIYFYCLKAGKTVLVKKMLLMK